MGEDVLVTPDQEASLRLLRKLDESGLDVRAAVWIFYPDSSTWTYVIAIKGSESEKEILMRISRLIRAERDKFPDLADIRIVDTDDVSLHALSQLVRAEGTNTIRATNNSINGIYFDDAIIHRLAL